MGRSVASTRVRSEHNLGMVAHEHTPYMVQYGALIESDIH